MEGSGSQGGPRAHAEQVGPVRKPRKRQCLHQQPKEPDWMDVNEPFANDNTLSHEAAVGTTTTSQDYLCHPVPDLTQLCKDVKAFHTSIRQVDVLKRVTTFIDDLKKWEICTTQQDAEKAVRLAIKGIEEIIKAKFHLQRLF
ncbi:hypothetical protein HDU90_001220 [Geranomyces variabilis]|nr:hypothetical protein HDU90_001220 [Geranomyces variabilis]